MPSRAATRRAPAAMDLVQRYAATFQPQGRRVRDIVDGARQASRSMPSVAAVPGPAGIAPVGPARASGSLPPARTCSRRLLLHPGRERGRVGAHVEELRPRALLRLAHLRLLGRRRAARSGCRDRRDRRARWPAPGTRRRRPARAPTPRDGRSSGTWPRLRRGIDVEGVVRAGLHARLAADAARAVEVHDAVGAGGRAPPSGRSSRRARCRSDCSASPRSSAACPGTCPSRCTSPTCG